MKIFGNICIVIGTMIVIFGLCVILQERADQAIHPLKVKWGDDFPHPGLTHSYMVMVYTPDGKAKYEFGLRADGVVVWREIKP